MHTVDNPIFEAVYKAVGKRASDAVDVLSALAALDVANDKLNLVEAYMVAKNFNPTDEHEVERLAQLEKNTQRSHVEHLRNKKVATWVLENIDSGMIVKMTGTRDKGYRQVIKIDSNFGGNYLECRQLEVSVPVGCRRSKKPKYDQLKACPYITTHMFKKVTAVLIDDEWKKVVDLIKAEQDEQSG